METTSENDNSETLDERMSDENPSFSPESIDDAPIKSIIMPMAPPPPRNPCISSIQEAQSDSIVSNDGDGDATVTTTITTTSSTMEVVEEEKHEKSQKIAVPYTIPAWSGPPCHPFQLEVLKDGIICNQFDVSRKGAYMFGRVDLCDFMLEHPTISRFHAVLQFKSSGEAYLYDLGSTHGTSLNKNQVKKKVYVELHVGDVIRFGSSSRLYIFQGPAELMLPEADLKISRNAKHREEMQDREASLQRARREASFANGISWGMGEDAIEEDEDDIDEVTWQTYKGQLTEKQEKTREKVLKRTEKIAHMKKEIDAIRAKDIGQGGLTQGQQTQIARNEQRMAQLDEELENLEETLNESIRESLGARSGKKSRNKRKGAVEDEEEEYMSDDDEFYDRTKKKSTIQKAGENQSIETADTLLDKKEGIMKQMEDKSKALLAEKNEMVSETEDGNASVDILDSYMSGLSSQLVLDKTAQIEKELSGLQSELDRVVYLLKIADPSGEAVKKRMATIENLIHKKSENHVPAIVTRPPVQPMKKHRSDEPGNGPITTKKPETDNLSVAMSESKTTVYSVPKPQWLGAVYDKEVKELKQKEAPLEEIQESEQFVDYKDRKTVLTNLANEQVKVDLGIDSAAPGLIIMKRKQVEVTEGSNDKSVEQSSMSGGAEINAEDAVALLLKHKRGYYASEDEEIRRDAIPGEKTKMDMMKPKRVIGPEKPSFLDGVKSDYETWVPPEGQSGDGRTSLNDRYGY